MNKTWPLHLFVILSSYRNEDLYVLLWKCVQVILKVKKTLNSAYHATICVKMGKATNLIYLIYRNISKVQESTNSGCPWGTKVEG
jgi:hypothetical protein